MNGLSPTAMLRRVCQAMGEAGITDPECQKGINFCVNQCPYDYCVVLETRPAGEPSTKDKVLELFAQDLTPQDIAQRLGKDTHTVYHYIRLSGQSAKNRKGRKTQKLPQKAARRDGALQLRCQGLTHKQIALRLGVTRQTVGNYLNEVD